MAAVLMAIGTRAEAQVTNGIVYYMSATPNPVVSNTDLTYTINLTNLTTPMPYVVVTNTLDVRSTFVSATNTFPGVSMTNYGNVVIFILGPFDIGQIAHITVIVQPTGLGLITNMVSLADANRLNSATNIFLVTQVITNTPPPPTQADLAVGVTGPPSAVFTNDLMTYGVNVTNLGPSTAPNVMLTNTLPPNVKYISISPSNHSYTVSIQNSNVIFSLGTLTNGAFRNFQITVVPTNAGPQVFSSVSTRPV